MRKKQETETKPKVEMRHYTDAELQKFHDMVQKYYYDYTVETGKDKGEVIRVLDKKKLMISYGVVAPSGAVLWDVDDFGDIKQPTRYAQFENLYEQWQYWKVRTGLDKYSGEYKKLEQLDEIAQQMTVDPESDEIPF